MLVTVSYWLFMSLFADILSLFAWATCLCTVCTVFTLFSPALPRPATLCCHTCCHLALTMDSEVISLIQKDIQELKESVNFAHENNTQTRTQVMDFKTDINSLNTRLVKLETELSSLRNYVVDLENYCISLDSIVRKHHLLLVGVNETKGESVCLAAYRVLQVCFLAIHISDIDYCYRIGTHAGKNRSPSRPIIVKLVREEHRRLIYNNRQTLRQSDIYSKVYINEDILKGIYQRGFISVYEPDA